MKMRYITRSEGPGAYGTRLGIAGILHATEGGRPTNDTAFECVVEDAIGGDPEHWGVTAIFAPLIEGLPGTERTMVLFGMEGKRAFPSFEDAFAFCASFGRSIYDKSVEVEWMAGTISRRGINCIQWHEAVEVVADPEDEVDESDGGTCDVTVGVDIPVKRVLH